MLTAVEGIQQSSSEQAKLLSLYSITPIKNRLTN